MRKFKPLEIESGDARQTSHESTQNAPRNLSVPEGFRFSQLKRASGQRVAIYRGDTGHRERVPAGRHPPAF
jgi:hypothetical protein